MLFKDIPTDDLDDQILSRMIKEAVNGGKLTPEN